MLHFKGIAANGGIAIGPAYHFNRSLLAAEDGALHEGEIETQLELLTKAVEKSKNEITKIAAIASQKTDTHGSAIFEAQRMMLEDSIVLGSIADRIRREHKTAAFIVDTEFSHYQHFLQTSDSPLLRERADDVEDVKQRLLRHLLENKKIVSKLDRASIVVAEFLTPADAILFSRHELLGFAMDAGGATSHVAILARSLGLPAIVGLRAAAGHINTGEIVIIDGDAGELIVSPDEETVALYQKKYEELGSKLHSPVKISPAQGLAKTRDDRSILVSMNMELISEEATEEAERIGTLKGKRIRGLGLLRTEHFLTSNDEIPSEEDQTKIYSDLAKRFSPASVAIRTFDIGGDKLIGGGFREKNPFLGWRGIRNLLDQPEVLECQLRAILRASTVGNIKVMFPMVTTIDELERTILHLESAKEQLRSDGEAFNDEIEYGVMIEVPAAALHADAFAARCDFLSIGSNDLTQYTLAVDRGNEFISHLFDELHPAVLRLISMTVKAAHRRKKPVSLCGELGGKIAALPIILGMGIDELSVAPNRVEELSAKIRKLHYRETQTLSRKILTEAHTVNAVKQIIYEFLKKRKLDKDFLTVQQIEALKQLPITKK